MIYRFANFELDSRLRELREGGRLVALPPLPLSVLLHLLANRDRVVGKDELLERVWQRRYVSESAVPTCMRTLRSALGDDPREPGIVATVRGRGYRLVASVKEIDPTEADSRVSDFVGRGAELEILHRDLDEVMTGRARAAFLVGEPGIGKSRLATEFARRNARGAVRVVEGHCVEGEGAPPFWPWTQVLRAVTDAHTADLEEPSRLLRHGADHFAAGSARDRFLLFRSVSEQLARVAADETLVIVLEDLHRADVPSLRLLEFALAELRAVPIFVLGTYRDAELGGDPARALSMGSVARRSECRFLQLEGLAPREIRELATLRTGRPPPDRIVSLLHEQSGGNPFFLTHLLTSLAGSTAAGVQAMRRLPHGVRDAISEQLAGLSQPHRAVLRRAAVFGREFERAVLELLCDSPAQVGAAVLAAEEARLLVPGLEEGSHRFSHMLVRDVLFSEIRPEERAELHLAAGRALEHVHRAAPDPWLPALAHHFGEAIAKAGPEKALRYAREAGADALRRLAYEESVEHYQRAVELAEEHEADEARRCETLLALGDAQGRACNRADGTATLLRAAGLARRIGAASHLAKAALRFAPGFFAVEAGLEDEALVGLLREALEVLGDDEPLLRAQLLGGLAMARYWVAPREELAGLIDEARRLAGARAAREIQVSVRQAALVAGWSADNAEERVGDAQALICTAQGARDSEAALVARLLRITSLLELGQLEQVDQGIAEFEHQARKDREAYGLWYTLLLKAMRHHLRGELDAAAASAEEFRALGEQVQGVNTELSLAAFNCVISWEQGRLERAMELSAELSDRQRLLPVVRAFLARVLFDLGAPDHARVHLAEVLADRHNFERKDIQWLWTLAFLAETCALLEDRVEAERLYRVLEPYRDRYIVGGFSVMCWGSVSRHLGQLAAALDRREEAIRHFEHALEQNRAIGARPFVALTECDYARFLSRGGAAARARARERATFARGEADAMGLVRLARTCEPLQA